MLSQPTSDALRFLSLSQEDKLRFLPQDDPDIVWVSPIAGEVRFVAEAAIRAALREIEIEIPDVDGDLAPRLAEIACVITLMLDVAEKVEYAWLLDKARYPIHGPYDDGWAVLKRLATLLLNELHGDLSLKVSAVDFLKASEFERSRRTDVSKGNNGP
jgi:hypothetical protein